MPHRRDIGWPRAATIALALSVCGLAPTAATGEPNSASSKPTFTRDVLPILQTHCQTCHRPGQVAPMSFLNYEQVRPWAKGIRKAVTDRTMPPFSAVSEMGHFQDDPRLTDAQINTLVQWIDAGAPQGNPADAPAPLTWNDSEWAMGKPDMILEFPEYTAKTINADEEVLVYSDYIFPKNTWIQAIELKSSDYTLLHHVGINTAKPDMFVPDDLVLDSADPDLKHFGDADNKPWDLPGVNVAIMSQNFLYSWLPGQRVFERRAGEGFRILKGQRFMLQVHVAPTTEAVKLKIRLGLKFVNGEIRSHSMEYVAGLMELRVPAGEPAHTERRIVDVKNTVTVTGFNMHMHLRGKSAQILFHYPDGRTEVALDIPNYDFNWQRVYYLAKPQTLPGGSKIEYIGVWDNSAANPRNPDPTVDAVFGGRSSDEMYTGNVYYSVERIHPLVVKNGIVTALADAEDQ